MNIDDPTSNEIDLCFRSGPDSCDNDDNVPGPDRSTGHHELELPEPGHVSGTCTGHVSPDYSPTTGQFVAECLAKGLPIIPFNYSTAEIVEKRRQTQRRKPTEVVTVTGPSSRGARSRDPSEPGSPVERTPAPEWSEAG